MAEWKLYVIRAEIASLPDSPKKMKEFVLHVLYSIFAHPLVYSINLFTNSTKINTSIIFLTGYHRHQKGLQNLWRKKQMHEFRIIRDLHKSLSMEVNPLKAVIKNHTLAILSRKRQTTGKQYFKPNERL